MLKHQKFHPLCEDQMEVQLRFPIQAKLGHRTYIFHGHPVQKHFQSSFPLIRSSILNQHSIQINLTVNCFKILYIRSCTKMPMLSTLCITGKLESYIRLTFQVSCKMPLVLIPPWTLHPK